MQGLASMYRAVLDVRVGTMNEESSMNIQRALARAIEGQHLAAHEMSAVMHQVMSGACTPAQIGV